MYKQEVDPVDRAIWQGANTNCSSINSVFWHITCSYAIVLCRTKGMKINEMTDGNW
jgi:hypothetical protein